MMNILHALSDEKVFAPFFKGDTWDRWRVFLSALFALPMTQEQLAIYQQCTNRNTPPSQPHTEAWLICGRRSGKSRKLALVAVFLAAFRDWRPHLAPGERGTIMIVAQNKEQAKTIMDFCLGLLHEVPMLARLIESETQERVDLKNRISIVIRAASYKSTRGFTIVAALLDELAMWPGDDSAEPDVEIIAAIKPGMATIPNALMLCASSPYARKGALWDAHRRHYGKDGDPVLVWQATTRDMNTTVPQRVIDEAMERDPARYSAEYYAQFRSDVEAFVDREAVQACVSVGVYERAPIPDVTYSAAVDPSGGSVESMCLAIGHREDDVMIIDCIRERKPPFNPDDVVRDFAVDLKAYGITKVTGDKYAGAWPVERFSTHGITYEASAKPKSNLYQDMLPLINSRKVDLVDDAALIAQIIGLERKTARGGRDSIDHAPNTCDDLANVVAGVVAMLASADAEYQIPDLARTLQPGGPLWRFTLPPPSAAYLASKAAAANRWRS